MQASRLAFGPFVLDCGTGVLCRDGAIVPLGHRGGEILQALASADGRIVTKSELMEAAWPGRVVEESNLSVQVAALRKLLGGKGDAHDWIATVPGVGYRFVGSVLREWAEPARASVQREHTPRIAVLPFVNLAGDAAQEYFADGITEDVILALSRFRWFFVIGRNSSFAFKGRAVDARQVATALQVRYVLEGTVRRADDRCRISARLIDAQTSSQIWGERYDVEHAETLGVQDLIAQRVAGAIEPELLRTESVLAASRPVAVDATAWDLVHRGAWLFHKVGPATHRQARDLFRQARVADENFAPAHAWLARVSAGIAAYGWADDEQAVLAEGLEAALHAIRLDEQNPYAHYSLAITSVYACSFPQAIRAAERATELSPSFALAHLVLGMAWLYSGDAARALAPLSHGLEINPFDPQNFAWYNALALAQLLSGDAGKALESAEQALKIRPDWPPALETAICCRAAAGQDAAAAAGRKALAEMRSSPTGDALAPLRRQNPQWSALLARLLHRE